MIVDDGSTDQTKELVESWKPSFPIRYFWKPNGGKHSAVNLGVNVAAGEFVLIFDSDDRCVPDALERFDHHWRQIPAPARFAALGVLCRTPEGAPAGTPYPASPIDAFTLKDAIRCTDGKEGWGIIRTDVLRQFPYPEGERFVIEGLVWNRMLRQYAVRFVNDPLRIRYLTPGGLSSTSMDLLVSSPKATLTYHRELFLSPAPWMVRLKALANYCRFAALTTERKLSKAWGRNMASKDSL